MLLGLQVYAIQTSARDYEIMRLRKHEIRLSILLINSVWSVRVANLWTLADSTIMLASCADL